VEGRPQLRFSSIGSLSSPPQVDCVPSNVYHGQNRLIQPKKLQSARELSCQMQYQSSPVSPISHPEHPFPYSLIPKLSFSASPSLRIASLTASFGAAANVARRYNSLSVPFSARNQLPRLMRTEWSTQAWKMDSSRAMRVSAE
jgi:hypothetical protein